MLFAVSDVAAVLALVREARRGPVTIAAYEFFSRRCLERLLSHRKLRPPFDQTHAYYVLLEVEGESDEWVASVLERGLVEDGTIAQHSSQARDLWTFREGISESLSATGLPHKNDVALPIAALDAFCTDLDGAFTRLYPDWEICLFGHVGDGNLHINVMKPDAMSREEFFAKTKGADRELFALVERHGGSISAEHGIGLLKKPFLSFSRSPEEIEVMRAVKRALDPNAILNPGKILD
jgi:FAD/FMN-containing dehydrogenase